MNRPDRRANDGRSFHCELLGSTMKLFTLLLACTLALLTACGSPEPGTSLLPDDADIEDDAGAPDASEPDAGEQPDAEEDANDPDIPDGSQPDADAEEPDCTCDAATECCDGCDPINAGASCDDGLECTLNTTCQPDGTCGASTGSPCDAFVDHPECQSVTCNEQTGCSAVLPIRNGFACETNTDELRVIEGTCSAGECVGRVCTCDEVSACCDGCQPIAEGETCDDGNPDTGADMCQAGACVGEPCNCDQETACCDGCFLAPAGTQCGEDMLDWFYECASHNTRYRFQRYAGCTGDSPICSEEPEHRVAIQQPYERDCPLGEVCYPHGGCGYP